MSDTSLNTAVCQHGSLSKPSAAACHVTPGHAAQTILDDRADVTHEPTLPSDDTASLHADTGARCPTSFNCPET